MRFPEVASLFPKRIFEHVFTDEGTKLEGRLQHSFREWKKKPSVKTANLVEFYSTQAMASRRMVTFFLRKGLDPADVILHEEYISDPDRRILGTGQTRDGKTVDVIPVVRSLVRQVLPYEVRRLGDGLELIGDSKNCPSQSSDDPNVMALLSANDVVAIELFEINKLETANSGNNSMQSLLEVGESII